ncbi:hypothetical protein [Pseudoalteromonas mariniglutinosa]|uniref:hypothetical protein n=1 Tax=Pseudoalteromonas mariniglutinosa TaxID=206042 RepID=UPI00384BD250
MIAVTKRPWYQGYICFWLKDPGCASYVISAILSTIVSFFLISIEQQLLSMSIMFALICIYSATAWQSIRMQATEWQFLVANYCQHVMLQGKLFITLINVLLGICVIASQSWHNLNALLLANTLGLSIWFICRVTNHLFTACCYSLITIAIVLAIFIEQLPLWLIPCSLLTCTVFLVCKNKYGTAYAWHNNALNNYRQGLQSGWSPVPSGLFANYGTLINKQLFPLSYFIGSGLSQYLIFLGMFAALAIAVNCFYDIAGHALFTLTILILATVTLCQWSKAQQLNSWQLLLTLPIYNSSHDAKVALSYSALKFTCLIAVLCLATSAILLLTNQQGSLLNIASYTMACAAAVLASFIIGNVCKNIHILSILLCLSFGFNMGVAHEMLEHGDNIITLLLVALYTCGLALLNRLSVKWL